jgi:hypothetical protein
MFNQVFLVLKIGGRKVLINICFSRINAWRLWTIELYGTLIFRSFHSTQGYIIEVLRNIYYAVVRNKNNPYFYTSYLNHRRPCRKMLSSTIKLPVGMNDQ